MADPLKKMCDELGVCKEEALFYLEGFRWDLNAAMEACRSKTLPPSENERAAAEERVRNEKIKSFSEWTKTTVEEARYFLSRNNWNVDHAVNSFLGDPPPSSHGGHTAPRFSGNQGSDTMQDVLISQVPKFQNTSTNLRIGSPPSASTPSVEQQQEYIRQFRGFVPEATSEAAIIHCLKHRKWHVGDASDYFYGVYNTLFQAPSGIATAQVVKNFSGMAVDDQHIPEATRPLMESEDPTQTVPPVSEEKRDLFDASSGPTETQRSLEEDGEGGDVIHSLVELAGGSVTRELAAAYLRNNNWDVAQAFTCFFEDQVQASQEDQTGRSSSSSKADSTDTGNATIGSSQVDENVKDEGVEEDLGTELYPVPITTTIELEIILDDGESGTPVCIPFRSDQTVRDIHDGVDAFRPEDKRDYYFKSDTGVEYRDLDTTVHTITSGSRGSTTLQQVYYA